MTVFTNRASCQAVARTETVRPALPPDPGLDALLADPRLGSTAKTIAVVIVKKWARFKNHAWPSDRSIGQAVNKSQGHIGRCLRQLEKAGWIAREKTAANRTGRIIRLLWRTSEPSAGARGGPAKAREGDIAKARDEQIVSWNRSMEPEGEKSSLRPRPELEPDPPLEAPPPEEALPAVMDFESIVRPEELPPPAVASSAAPSPPALDPGTLFRLPAADPSPARSPSPAAPAARPHPAPPSEPAPGRRCRDLRFTTAELAAVVKRTGDPVLAAELARRTAPPPPPALLARLPGRHDLIVAATHRLCEDLGDFKPATWSFARQAVESVARRAVGAEVLIDCHRQATGPKARDKGCVFTVAWKREGRAPS